MSAAKYIDVQRASSAVFFPLFLSSKSIIYEAKTKTIGKKQVEERGHEIQ